MKYKTIEKTVQETVYEAIDGTIFTNKEECERYDGTCEAIVKARFLSFSQRIEDGSVADRGICGVMHTDDCCEESSYYLSEPKTTEDCNAIAQFIKVFGDNTDITSLKADERYLGLAFCELKPGEKYIVELEPFWGGVYSEERIKTVMCNRARDAFHGAIKKEEEKKEETK